MLITYLGGKNLAGDKLKEVGANHWASSNVNATNTSGFTALAGGARYMYSPFEDLNTYGHWWSSTQSDTADAWAFIMYSNISDVGRSDPSKQNGFSVRCIRDY